MGWSPLSSVGTYIRHFGTQMPFWGGATIPLTPERPVGQVVRGRSRYEKIVLISTSVFRGGITEGRVTVTRRLDGDLSVLSF